ncbi:hypothetical protein DAI22_11g208400 [Oryza sativa Japonica Group]|nr:hypothetical protein DAI22_11g208400 [Oryza sativa Japonica Group]
MFANVSGHEGHKGNMICYMLSLSKGLLLMSHHDMMMDQVLSSDSQRNPRLS